MKSVHSFMPLAVLLSLMTCCAVIAQGQGVPLGKWEYKTVLNCPYQANEVNLDQLGEEGWELVGVDRGVSSGTSSDCVNYYFKRPKSAATRTPAKPAEQTPRCNLTIAQAPAVRGLRIGMSADDVFALFPGSKEQVKNKEALEKAARNYGVTGLQFSPEDYPDHRQLFNNNVTSYSVSLLDGRVAAVHIRYSFNRPEQNPSWDIESWVGKLAETFGLPGIENWQAGGNRTEKKLLCHDLQVQASAYSNNASFGITAHSLPTELKRRREKELEQRRKAFNP